MSYYQPGGFFGIYKMMKFGNLAVIVTERSDDIFLLI